MPYYYIPIIKSLFFSIYCNNTHFFIIFINWQTHNILAKKKIIINCFYYIRYNVYYKLEKSKYTQCMSRSSITTTDKIDKPTII